MVAGADAIIFQSFEADSSVHRVQPRVSLVITGLTSTNSAGPD